MMPVDVTNFRPFSEKNLRMFLEDKYPLGYTATELTEIFNRDRTTISTYLNRLKKKKKVNSIQDGRNHYYYYYDGEDL